MEPVRPIFPPLPVEADYAPELLAEPVYVQPEEPEFVPPEFTAPERGQEVPDEEYAEVLKAAQEDHTEAVAAAREAYRQECSTLSQAAEEAYAEALAGVRTANAAAREEASQAFQAALEAHREDWLAALAAWETARQEYEAKLPRHACCGAWLRANPTSGVECLDRKDGLGLRLLGWPDETPHPDLAAFAAEMEAANQAAIAEDQARQEVRDEWKTALQADLATLEQAYTQGQPLATPQVTEAVLRVLRATGTLLAGTLRAERPEKIDFTPPGQSWRPSAEAAAAAEEARAALRADKEVLTAAKPEQITEPEVSGAVLRVAKAGAERLAG